MKLNWWTVENMQASVLVIDLCCSYESVPMRKRFGSRDIK